MSTQAANINVSGAADGDCLGYGLSSGDVNGDAYDDIIVSAPYSDPGDPVRSNAGETYLISGGGAFITVHGLGGKNRINCFSLLGRSCGGFKAFGGVNAQGEVHLGKSNY